MTSMDVIQLSGHVTFESYRNHENIENTIDSIWSAIKWLYENKVKPFLKNGIDSSKITVMWRKLLSCDAWYRISTGTLINHKLLFDHECNSCNNNKNQTTNFNQTDCLLKEQWNKDWIEFFWQATCVMTFEFIWLMLYSFTCNKNPSNATVNKINATMKSMQQVKCNTNKVIALQADCKSLSEHPWKFLNATDVV